MPGETVTNQAVQTEVTLRTLSSDIQSIEHGAGTPAPTSLKITSQAQNGSESTEVPAPAPKKIGKTIILIIALAAIAGVGYFYLYPRLIEALTPPVAVH